MLAALGCSRHWDAHGTGMPVARGAFWKHAAVEPQLCKHPAQPSPTLRALPSVTSVQICWLSTAASTPTPTSESEARRGDGRGNPLGSEVRSPAASPRGTLLLEGSRHATLDFPGCLKRAVREFLRCLQRFSSPVFPIQQPPLPPSLLVFLPWLLTQIS